ncbi:metal ABC transporter ATP-binding protein [Salibacterium halotolerans]|uniref:Manganese/zinc/iron transport system ATP-binding protein n=1 Tax=Salibacterium halotolerans TaxID=1884432 RepID=A0A1I5V5A5_9BACI|nr:metal ABC transporter ATP-binding protein [Salibacterium halotolerans]SFQ02116.1 manganese/zinc/iron transport system ATP-binding protein [Salibacterium halotolerans]
MSDALDVQNITVAYQESTVLENAAFSVPQGKLVGIVGPNGAGKSTLLKAVLDLVPKLHGRAVFFGDELKKVRSSIGYVPQRGEVDWDFPTNALDVVTMGRYGHVGLFRRPRKQDREVAFQSLKELGMEDYAKRQIRQLSGGQQQRVFLARAMAQDASLYIMDEPFAGIDAKTERAIIELMQKWKQQNKTIIVVHHDLQTAREYFDWMILLNKQVVAQGPTEEVFTKEKLQQAYGGQLAFLQSAASEETGGLS